MPLDRARQTLLAWRRPVMFLWRAWCEDASECRAHRPYPPAGSALVLYVWRAL